MVVILGIGGVGKTTLAAKAAREVRKSFDYASGVLYNMLPR